MRSKFLISAIAVLLFAGNAHMQILHAQEDEAETVADTIAEHSPRKATLYSTMLPGLGQIYNKQVWKVPVIYAGFGAIGYYIVTNTQNYNTYSEATALYFRDLEDDGLNDDKDNGWQKYVTSGTPKDELTYYRNLYRRWLELSIISAAGWYLLNILDANVYGHLFDFDISKDLSLHIEPTVITPIGEPSTLGMNLSFKF